MDYNKIISMNNSELNALVFSRHKDKLSTNLDQETIILDITSGIYSQLNTVGTSIWEILSQPATFETVLNKILVIYDISEEKCINEILCFLRELAEHQLIQVNNESDT